MKRTAFLLAFLTLGWNAPVPAQHEALPFLMATTGKQVFILLLNPPAGTEGFNVYRKGPGDRDFRLVTAQPVVPVIEPLTARDMLGDDYPWVARALRAEDEFDVVQRLRSDLGAAVAVSFASLQAARVAGRLFTDSRVASGERYTYRVEFLGYDGESLGTAERTVTVRNRKPPSPSGVKVKAGDSNVRISWEFPAYAGDPGDITVGFHIYRKATDGPFTRLNRVLILRQDNLKHRTDVNVTNNESYTYYVTAVDFIGRESDPSEKVTAVPRDLTPPKFPQGLQLLPDEGKVLITWKMNLELDVTHYDIYKSLEMNEGYEKINPEPIRVDQPRYEDTDVYYGPLYYYKVKAIDRSGNESEFSNAISGRPNDTSAPSRPDSLTAHAEQRYVTLSWVAPPDRDLLGYYVYRRRDGENFLRIAAEPLPPDSLTFRDTGYSLKGLWPGKRYEYAVSALDNMYNESPLATVQVDIPDDEPPTPPLSSHARSTPEGQVRITWQQSMALDVKGYRVYRSTEQEPPLLLLETGDSTFAAVDSTAEQGRTYYYQVAALDEAGNESEKTEKTAVVPRDLTAPPAPQGVRVATDSSGLWIHWEAVQASDLQGYNIYRLDLPTTAAQKLNTAPVQETRFFDPEGKPGQYYRVSSLDTSGNENAEGTPVPAGRPRASSPEKK